MHIHGTTMKSLPLLALLIANCALANGLDDLKTALAPLQGQGALRGTYEAKETKTNLSDKPAKPAESATASALVDEDASGFQIRWDRALLKRAADEASPARGASKKEALNALIGSSSAPKVAQAVNYAPRLLQYLATGTLKSERADTYQGKSARVLEVMITPQEEENDKVKVKENSHLARIWVGADGLPLAATIDHSIKVSMMVFLSYEKASKEEMTFGVMANRLVLLKREDQGKEKGLGNESQYRNLYTFTPKA